MTIKIKKLDLLLGIALGTGYLTSLRFLGPIGYSELLFFITAAILITKNYNKILTSHRNIEGFIRYYFIFSSFIIMPTITLITFTLNDIEKPDPIYIISFAFGVILTFLIIEGVRSKQINPASVAIVFALTFIISNFISLFVFNLGGGEERFSGGAKNPNQLLFYASTLSLLLIIYHKRKSIILLPIIIFIMLKTKSDAYVLSLVVMAGFFIYLKSLFFLKKTSLIIKTLTHLLIAISVLLMVVYSYSDAIVDIWLNADEGNARVDLMWNGLLASLQSPLFGWGAGSFSGLNAPFEGGEAHNTFLDLSMSFGFLFPILIYIIFFSALLKSIKNNDHLVSAFILGFILSGLFHFSGRHFAFWIEVAVFMVYLFPQNTTSPKEKQNNVWHHRLTQPSNG